MDEGKVKVEVEADETSKLYKKLDELKQRQRQAEANMNAVLGAVQIINELIEENKE